MMYFSQIGPVDAFRKQYVNDRKMLGLPEDAVIFSTRQTEIIINGAQGNSL